MDKKLVVHIGLPKTGTTSIQNFFAHNDEVVKKITYIETGRGNAEHHHNLAALLGASVPLGLLAHVPKGMDADSLAEQINLEIRNSHSPIAFISSEFFSVIDYDKLNDFFDKIEFQTEYIATFTNPCLHAISSWSEMVKGGMSDFGLFDYLHTDVFQSQTQLIKNWLSPVQRRPLSYAFVDSTNAVATVLKSIDPDSKYSFGQATEPYINISLTPAATEVLRRLHIALPDIGSSSWAVDYWPTVLGEISHSNSRCINYDSSLKILEILASEVTIFRQDFGQEVSEGICKSRLLEKYTFVSDAEFENQCSDIFMNFSNFEIRTNALAHNEIYRLNHIANADRKESQGDFSQNDTIDDFFVVGDKSAPFMIAGHSHRRAVEAALIKSDSSLASSFCVLTGGLPLDSGVYWDFVAEATGKLCIFWNGNEANVLSILPDDLFQVFTDDVKTTKEFGIPVVSRSNLESYFSDRLKPLIDFLEGVSCPSRVILCSPPPPKPREFLLNMLASEDYFNKRFVSQIEEGKDLVILGDSQRVAIQKIYLFELRKIAEKFGASFLESPPQTVSNDGTLLIEYSADDCTHANEKYGALVLDQLFEIGGLGE